MKNLILDTYEYEIFNALVYACKPMTAGQLARRTHSHFTPRFIENTLWNIRKRYPEIIEVIVPGDFKPFKFYTNLKVYHER